MSESSERLMVNRDRGPSWEGEIGEILNMQLTSPWSITRQASSIEVETAGPALSYRPDFTVKNDKTGEVLVVELKTRRSLSIPNVLKLKQIQTAVEETGQDFLLLFETDKSDPLGADFRLSEYGVNAVAVSNASEAATEIVKHLAT